MAKPRASDADAIVDRMRRAAEDTATAGAAPPARGAGQTIPGTAAHTAVKMDEAHDKNKATLLRALQTSERTNAMGEETAAALGAQRGTIERSLRHTDEMHDELRMGRTILRDMRRHLVKEKVIKGLVIACLLLCIWIIIYVKWIKKKG